MDSTERGGETGVSGTLPKDELAGGIDLQLTLASGQSYRWRRADGVLFEPPAGYPTPWYETVHEGRVIRVREHPDRLEWHGSHDVADDLVELLRLDDDLPAILATGPDVDVFHEAVDRCAGMRLVRDSTYVALLSFICSTQMRVERIHGMVRTLMERFGPTYTLDGRVHHGFPDPATLAATDEATLRDCGLGYRAPYVLETARMVASDGLPAGVTDDDYAVRRDALTVFAGVGPKVADCALLFGAGDLEAVPLDRWIRRAIEDHFPDCVGDDYAATSRAIRRRLGSYPGYAQTYLFHHLRTGAAT